MRSGRRLCLLDSEGKERVQVEGYLPNNDFLAALRNGLAASLSWGKKYSDAERWYGNVAARFGDSPFAPEAMYWQAVAQYSATHEHTVLGKAVGAFHRRRIFRFEFSKHTARRVGCIGSRSVRLRHPQYFAGAVGPQFGGSSTDYVVLLGSSGAITQGLNGPSLGAQVVIYARAKGGAFAGASIGNRTTIEFAVCLVVACNGGLTGKAEWGLFVSAGMPDCECPNSGTAWGQ